MAKKPTTPQSAEPSKVPAAAKPAAKAASKAAPKKVAVPKTTASAEPKPAKAPALRAKVKAAAVTKPTVSITPADIALRAYFIAEKRQKLGLPGDSTSDWVEAERQLHAEAALQAKK
jgi:hypothetical protein